MKIINTVTADNGGLFDKPLRSGKVRTNVFYHQYRNGTINIEGKKYIQFSIKDAVKHWRKNNPK
jgi:hypothetical protein